MTLIQKLTGCHKGGAHRMWRGEWKTFDFEKPYDCLRWRAINRWEWLLTQPAWRVADWLCWLACKLRRHRTHEGWYGIQCNEAEILSQNIQEHLIPFSGDNGEVLPVTIEPEDAEAMRQNLDRLAALARATFWHDT